MAAGATHPGSELPHHRHPRPGARADLRGRMRGAGAEPAGDAARASRGAPPSRKPRAGCSTRCAPATSPEARSAPDGQRCCGRSAALRPGRHRRPAQRRQVDPAECAGRRRRSASPRNKAQTTRHRITGMRTVGATQFVFVDTPGFQTRHGAALNRSLNRAVVGTLADVDVVLFVVEAGRFGAGDEAVLALVDPAKPVLLVANKLDLVPAARRARTLAAADAAAARRSPNSCRCGDEPAGRCRTPARDRREVLARAAVALRRGCADRPQRPLPGRGNRAREAVPPHRRRAALHLDGRDRPATRKKRAACAGSPRRSSSSATAHKAMIIGAGGERLKRIGTEARQELERLLDAQGLPRALGQGEERLGRRRSAPALATDMNSVCRCGAPPPGG